MNILELLYEIRDKYDLSTADMARLLGVSDSSMSKWTTGKSDIPNGIGSELVQIEQDILWLASYLEAHPELDNYTHAHFKAALNSLDIKEML